jgi:signal transduction histidine kinase
LEPGLVAAGWALLATAAVTGTARLHAARRRVALNRALHELRRPLQALALTPGQGLRGAGALELALVALDDLDLAINGARPRLTRRPLAARPLVAAAVERWRGIAARRERALVLEWAAGRAVVIADPIRLGQALDNLLANAIEHGALRVIVRVERAEARLRISVVTAARPTLAAPASDPRRGHGLAVVERIAAAHMGRFTLRRDRRGVKAVLELPLAPEPVPTAAIQWAPPSRPPGRAPTRGERTAARTA